VLGHPGGERADDLRADRAELAPPGLRPLARRLRNAIPDRLRQRI
jgi:hypothetical protein